jgi:hypothetical protein
MNQELLSFYAAPGGMTFAGRHAARFAELPRDVSALVGVVQGLALHAYVASSLYGYDIPDERQAESHLRTMEAMLDCLLTLDSRPLSIARPVSKRLVGVCHHSTLLMVAMLRARGVAARARCGFGTYFNPGYFEDHWVCEYWSDAEARWVLVDAQFDETWRAAAGIDHDVLDVPRDRFLVAGEAWARCRAGHADPSKFGIAVGGLRGLWFIAGNVIRDVAALNKIEMLPWDVWGGMPGTNGTLTPEQLAFIDELAAFSRTPDAFFEQLRRRYESDDRVRVGGTVFNAVLNRPETV